MARLWFPNGTASNQVSHHVQLVCKGCQSHGCPLKLVHCIHKWHCQLSSPSPLPAEPRRLPKPLYSCQACPQFPNWHCEQIGRSPLSAGLRRTRTYPASIDSSVNRVNLPKYIKQRCWKRHLNTYFPKQVQLARTYINLQMHTKHRCMEPHLDTYITSQVQPARYHEFARAHQAKMYGYTTW